MNKLSREDRKKILTVRQRQIFSFILKFISEKGYPPTFREISTQFRFTEKVSHDHITTLIRKGCIHKLDNIPRSIRIVPKHRFYFLVHKNMPEHGICKGDAVIIDTREGIPYRKLVAVQEKGNTVLKSYSPDSDDTVLGSVIGICRELSSSDKT